MAFLTRTALHGMHFPFQWSGSLAPNRVVSLTQPQASAQQLARGNVMTTNTLTPVTMTFFRFRRSTHSTKPQNNVLNWVRINVGQYLAFLTGMAISKSLVNFIARTH